MQWGIGVWVKHLVDFDSHIYVIATPEAFQRLNELKLDNVASTAWQRMVPISETIFPFTFEDTKFEGFEGNKKTWVFQQLLKLYSHSILQNDGLSDMLLLGYCSHPLAPNAHSGRSSLCQHCLRRV